MLLFTWLCGGVCGWCTKKTPPGINQAGRSLCCGVNAGVAVAADNHHVFNLGGTLTAVGDVLCVVMHFQHGLHVRL